MSARPPILLFRQLRDITARSSADADQFMAPNDWERLVNPSDHDISVFLPPSQGRRSMKRVKRIDSTENDHIVSVFASGSDKIDDSASVVLIDPWSEVWLIDALPGFWDHTGSTFPNGLPNGGTTGQIIAKASDDDNDFIWIDPPVAFTPASVRPTNAAEVISTLAAMGLWP